MSPRRLRLRVLLATVAAALAFATVPAAPQASAASYVTLNGDGSSWAQPAIQQWTRDIANQGIQINYTGDGSAQGRQKYIEDQNDFAGSDIAFLTQGDPFGAGLEKVGWNYSYIPIVAGGTTFIYNLTVAGKKVTNLRLSGQTIAQIFTGAIKNWDDPRITHDYGAQLPNQPITVVTRSDGSGASYMFTRWLSTEYKSMWNSFCAAHGGPKTSCGPTEFYPGFGNSVQKDGSDQMATFLASSISNGAIGYDEYAYALNYGLPAVKMLNAAGYYSLPTPSNVAIALQAAIINNNPKSVDYLMQDLDNVYTFKDPRTYPLSSYSYLVIPRDVGGGSNNAPPPTWSTAKGATLSTWLDYVLCGAQKSAGNLGYSPLPENLVTGGFAQVAHVPGHVPNPNISQPKTCDSPTFQGVGGGKTANLLIQNAPLPSPCDFHTAPLNCVVSGGKAKPAGGSGGSGGPGSVGPGNANAAQTGGPSATAGAGPSASFDPNTGQFVGGGNGTAGSQDIAAEPVAVAARPDEQSLLAALTVLEILAAVSAPVAVGAWLQRRRKRG